jgi:ubiquitin C-terminal hydrolase
MEENNEIQKHNTDISNNAIHQPSLSLKGICGMMNMRNTCYVNSCIQVLRAVSEWSSYCVDKKHIPEIYEKNKNNHTRILFAFHELLKSLWSAHHPSYVRPSGFLETIRDIVKGTIYEQFGHPIPNDCHEYLVYLLDNFHEATKQNVNSEIVEAPYSQQNKNENEKLKMRIEAHRAWAKFLEKNMSPVVELFFGLIRKTVTCANCNNKTYNWEPFNILKIPCEGNSLVEWIQNEFKISEIEGFDCEKCRPNRQLAHTVSHIWMLPKALFVSISRFNYDGKKKQDHVPYKGENIAFKDIFAPESNEDSKNWEYQLRGVIDHHGSHLGGHYTSQFCHPQSNEWWFMDDERTQKMNNPIFGSSTYIMLFKRKN